MLRHCHHVFRIIIYSTICGPVGAVFKFLRAPDKKRRGKFSRQEGVRRRRRRRLRRRTSGANVR